jgi:hypothetical protein
MDASGQLEDATEHFGVLVPGIRETLPPLKPHTGELSCQEIGVDSLLLTLQNHSCSPHLRFAPWLVYF